MPILTSKAVQLILLKMGFSPKVINIFSFFFLVFWSQNKVNIIQSKWILFPGAQYIILHVYLNTDPIYLGAHGAPREQREIFFFWNVFNFRLFEFTIRNFSLDQH